MIYELLTNKLLVLFEILDIMKQICKIIITINMTWEIDHRKRYAIIHK